jgi:hypothetical protein
MMTLVGFLRARIAEEEDAVKAVRGEYLLFIDPDDGTISEPVCEGSWDAGGYERWADGEIRLPNRHGTWSPLFDPARVLAKCEAKLRIVEEVEEHRDYTYATDWDLRQTAKFLDDILRILAQPYADHPDFRDEWRL